MECLIKNIDDKLFALKTIYFFIEKHEHKDNIQCKTKTEREHKGSRRQFHCKRVGGKTSKKQIVSLTKFPKDPIKSINCW